MPVSRSALEYIRRRGLSDENLRPSPRLNVTDLLVHTVPLTTPPRPSQAVLRTYEGGEAGESPPDRGAARPWPGQAGTEGADGRAEEGP